MRKNLLTKYIEEDETQTDLYSNRKNANAAQQNKNLINVDSSANSFNIKDLEDQDERDIRRYEIQCELNNQGASDLVVDLFMSEISNKVFKENVLLAIALLEGGNTNVQVKIDFIYFCVFNY